MTHHYHHIQTLKSTVYVFIHKNNSKFKMNQLNLPRKFKKHNCVEYDRKNIYRFFIEKNNKSVGVKNLEIFENANQKNNTEIFIYKAILTEKNGGREYQEFNFSPIMFLLLK